MFLSPAPELLCAVRAARAAGDMIRLAAADPATLEIRQKHPNDFVTQVDVASERAIARILKNEFPGHGFQGEESAIQRGRSHPDHLWIVDPLDGTTNFIHGYPAFSVSIALSVAGQIQHGVVLDVCRDILYHASRGEGAYSLEHAGASQGVGPPEHTRRLAVSTRAGLDGALVATSCPYRPGPAFESSLQMLGQVMLRVAAIRRSGSAALDLAHTAAGLCDGCFDLGLAAWDVAAGSLLVQEAGGQVGNFAGGSVFLEQRECVAGNPAVFAALCGVLKPYAAG